MDYTHKLLAQLHLRPARTEPHADAVGHLSGYAGTRGAWYKAKMFSNDVSA